MNILKNRIGEEGLKAIIDAWKASKSLKSICGATSAELDLSGQQLGGYGDIPVVCAEIKNNGALTSLNLANNDLRAEGAKHIAEAIKANVSVRCDSFGTVLSSI